MSKGPVETACEVICAMPTTPLDWLSTSGASLGLSRLRTDEATVPM